MARKLGPVLSFRGVVNQHWRVSALVVMEADDPAPLLTWQPPGQPAVTATPQALGTPPGAALTIWRFDLLIALSETPQQIVYTLADNPAPHTFSVPARGGMPNMAYVSCNGFSSMKLMNDTRDPYAMWRDLRDRKSVV